MSVLPSAPSEYRQRDQAALRQILTQALSDLNQARAAIKALQAASGGAGGITELTGDVTAGPGSGSQAATIASLAVTTAKIAANAVSNAKLAQMATHLVKANITGSTADPQDVTVSDLLDLL